MAKPKRKPIFSNTNLYHPEFFKIFLPHHFTSQKLRIPSDYVKNFSRTIKERIVLKDEEGSNAWHVNVETNLNGVFITGWQSFVDHKCLSVGDFLVFRYDGCYSFIVKTFGTNGCKKDSSVAKTIGTKIKIEKEEEEDDESEEKSGCKRARVVKEDCPSRSKPGTEIQEVYELDSVS